LLHGGVWAIAARVVGIIAALAVNGLLARLLTPENMGVYFLIISVVSVAALVAQAGLPSSIVRLIAESMGKGDGERARVAIRLSVVFCGLFSLIVAGAFYFGVGQWAAIFIFKSTPMVKTIGVAAVLIIVTALQGLIVEIFRGFHDMRLASLFGGVTTPVFSVMAFGGIWLLQGYAGLHDILLLLLGGWLLSFFIAMVMLRPKFSMLHGGGDIDGKSLLKISIPMGVTSLAIFAANQGDLWVVGAFLPEQQAAVYGAVLRFVMIMTMTHSLVVAVVQSTIAEMYGEGDLQRVQRIAQGSALVACTSAFGLILVYVVFGHELLVGVFGEFYGVGYWSLLIICTGQFVGMLFGSAGMVLMMTGYQSQFMKLSLATASLGILLAIGLVTIYGMTGVAIAWGLGAVFQGVGSWMLVKRFLNIKCHASLVSVDGLRGAFYEKI